jgi:transcriptional regulator of acetoin/glycerol metabolism
MGQWRFPDGPAAMQVAMRSRWETFQRAGAIAEGVRPEIARSWQRAARANLQPALRAAPVDVGALRGFDDAGPARRRFFHAAGRVAGELAAELDDAAAAAIVVCDAGGLLLHRAGPDQVLALMEEYNLVPGGVWNELGAGTTAVGLALATGGPANVYAAEHFAEALHGFSCTAAPVRHPVTREILGVLSLATGASVSAFYSQPLMLTAARDVEHRLQEQVDGRERELMEHYLRSSAGQTSPFLTVDRAGHTVIQNAPMLKTACGDEIGQVLEIARETLAIEADVTGELHMSGGHFLAEGHVVRDAGEIQGALVSLQPIAGPRPARPVPLGGSKVIGDSEPMQRVLADAERIAPDRPPTMIWGEPGTGKLMLAEHLHRIGGCGPLTLVGCASDGWQAKLDRAAAVGGTAVLRRLHALTPAVQLQLCDRLDALTEAGVMPWLIALANPQAPRPQEELLSRLGGASLVLPPLRDRPADIRPLVEHWCATREHRFGARPVLSAGAWELVLSHAWPGNERELMSTLDAASRRGGPVIGGKSLQLGPVPFPSASLRDIERAAIEAALQRTGGNVSQAARELGIGRATLHRRLRDYRLLDSRITVDG